MSDAWEEWDFDEYNRIKSQRPARTLVDTSLAYEQCFIKIGTKLYGDVINLPMYLLKNKVKSKDEDGLNIYETKAEKQTRLRKYISMFVWSIKSLDIKTKIKIITINNKCIQVI
jgi:hypothetical protein